MRQLISVITCSLLALNVLAQWPTITATDLNDNIVELPAKKNAVIGLAFSQKAQDDLVTWLEPLYKQLLDPKGTGSWVYDGEAYLVIAFTGAKKAALNKARKQIKEATDKDFYSNVLLYEGSMSEFKSLPIKDAKTFYVFTISPFGDVLESASGKYRESTLDKLCEPLEQ